MSLLTCTHGTSPISLNLNISSSFGENCDSPYWRNFAFLLFTIVLTLHHHTTIANLSQYSLISSIRLVCIASPPNHPFVRCNWSQSTPCLCSTNCIQHIQLQTTVFDMRIKVKSLSIYNPKTISTRQQQKKLKLLPLRR